MTRPFSPDEVDAQITDLLTQLDDKVTVMPELAAAANDAKLDYEHAHAHAILAARADEQAKSAQEREALAFLASEQQKRRMVAAETVYDVHKRSIAVLSSKGDLLRTLAVSRRAVGDERR